MIASLHLDSGQGQFALSDTNVVFARDGQLFVRAFSSEAVVPIAAFPGQRPLPFLSPDGQWVGYYSAGRLKKVPITGGTPVDICDVDRNTSGLSGDWGTDGIVFSRRTEGLFVVAADTGTPRVLLVPDKATLFLNPVWLPGRKIILYTEAKRVGTGDQDLSSARVMAISADADARPVKIIDGAMARYAAGRLMFLRDSVLVAAAFDPQTLKVLGPPTPMRSDVSTFRVSPNGTVLTERDGRGQMTYVWVDRQGRTEATGIPADRYRYPRISPDGTRIVIPSETGERDLLVWDVRQKSLSRLTTEKGIDSYPVWTPDSRSVIYGAERNAGDENIAIRSADGIGALDFLLKSDRHQAPYTISPDGRWLVFRDEVPGHLTDLGLLDMRTRQATPLIATPFAEQNGEISPDGKLLAYQSDETGNMEIYVRPFPNVNDGKKQISSSGGHRPVWSRDGRALFFESDRQTPGTMRAALRKGAGLDFSQSEALFDLAPFVGQGLIGRTYDVAADGRFLMPKRADDSDRARGLTLILNWASTIAGPKQ